MAKVKVYKYRKWNQPTGDAGIAPRMATREFIAKARGTIIDGTEREVDGGAVDHNGQARISSS